MRSWLQEYFLPYTCTLLRLVTSYLKSSVHHVIARLVCSKDLYWNFVSAMWPGVLDFLWPLIAMRQYQFRLPPWTLGGDTIEGAEMDSLGSPLGPWGPWSPLGPGGPWSPWVALFPLGPWGPRGPGGPCLPGAPGLPRLPLIPLGQFTLQARLLRASWTSLLMSSRLTIRLMFDFLFLFFELRLWRLCVSAIK